MRHARSAGWMIALGVVVAVVGAVTLRRSVAAEEPSPSSAAAATARALASLKVSAAPNGGRLRKSCGAITVSIIAPPSFCPPPGLCWLAAVDSR